MIVLRLSPSNYKFTIRDHGTEILFSSFPEIPILDYWFNPRNDFFTNDWLSNLKNRHSELSNSLIRQSIEKKEYDTIIEYALEHNNILSTTLEEIQLTKKTLFRSFKPIYPRSGKIF